jgi:hypothetical protein
MWREFRDFAVRGNVVDLGVGLILQDAVRPGRDAGYSSAWADRALVGGDRRGDLRGTPVSRATHRFVAGGATT